MSISWARHSFVPRRRSASGKRRRRPDHVPRLSAISRVGESGLAIVGAARAGVGIRVDEIAGARNGPCGVTANTVSLGLVETGHYDPEWLNANRDKLVRLYPVRRLGRPDDVAPTVTLLASPRSGWITGQVISVSGGYCMV